MNQSTFELLQIGLGGQVEVVAARPPLKDGITLPLSTLPIGLPPVLKHPIEEVEDFLCHPEKLPIHDLENNQEFWGRKINPGALYHTDVCPLQTTITVERNPTTGEMLGFKEEFLTDTGSTAKNSLSLHRPPGPPEEGLRGSSTNFPFWPGGLDEPDIEHLKDLGATVKHDTSIDFSGDLLSVPPGFEKGVDFERKALDRIFKAELKTDVLSLTDILGQAEEIHFSDDSDNEGENIAESKTSTQLEEIVAENKENLDEIIKLESRPVGFVTAQTEEKKVLKYAVNVDVNSPVDDFYKRIPDMAYKWPFELDVFQKQAILHLENHENVFVAAHTSAGKTVVAEYAVALSLRHMTRTIYTSPIKALSNQKFRDFKVTFGDVGLVTGDVQINPEASCLIMTTEILRSMLYNGSDVIRDLEWVIFDEVHYINDTERGVVWEEVLIMLPDHVSIILLSATVHNTLQFADWVGTIKKKKVYVVSTQKRPVPLEHYLYTGNSAKTSDELFMLVDSKKSFLTAGYNKAANAKKERASKSKDGYGAKGARGGNPHQDKNIWLSIINMLKKDKLPILAFTFSKKRIEDNSQHMSSIDLCTARERHQIHSFFQKCISRLKGTDRELPQVKQINELLLRGIGIHHSGVLPILKEVVEMLFHRGLVKILLATETFAMGVNMPARTVIFDSINKHDGKEFRELLPGEYIQMAGRAGRRGLDSTGTVIILCKGDVPEMASLHKMMLGKPTELCSQFRVTYAMILNLLRVEQLRVEDMMKRSFFEFDNQKNSARFKQDLVLLQEEISELPEIVDYSGDLEQYYLSCDEYHDLKSELQDGLMAYQQTFKVLSPGRVVLIDNNKHNNALGVILQSSAKTKLFNTLIICEKTNCEENECEGQSSIKPYTSTKLFYPDGPCGHLVDEMRAQDISAICDKTIKINAEGIINDFKKRQIPRFKNDPPGQSASMATQDLLRLVEANPNGLPVLDPVRDLHVQDIDYVESHRRLKFLRDSFAKYRCIHDSNFKENFKQMQEHMKLRKQYDNIKFQLSDKSLQMLPEYRQRIEVLKTLGYIDGTHAVQLKGRVACEISNHELIITELLFENALTNLHPREIAALLSCVVFEMRRCSEPNLSPELKKAKETFMDVATRIGICQRDHKLKMAVDDYVEQFHFNLMEVVHEWAKGLAFSKITDLTDVQEGIIVRSIQRLDEVLKDVRNAARIIGDPTLADKMEQASTFIKRDIVFAASLYTQ